MARRFDGVECIFLRAADECRATSQSMEALATKSLDAVRSALAGARDDRSPVALQSTVATSKEAVSRVLVSVRSAEEAALSLAQREQLSDIRLELEELEEALGMALTDRGRCVLSKSGSPKTALRRLLDWRHSQPPPAKWDDALAEAMEGLEAGSDLLIALASGQPTDTAARAIAETTARLLCEHLAVLREALPRWLR
jgi:hypothetical protein